MRRRPGIQGLKKKQDVISQYKNLGENMAKERLGQMEEQMNVFRKSLEEFAVNYREDIRRDPLFRQQFHQMCRSIGVDPLASNKGMWAEILGFGDFYYELGVQVVEACLIDRSTSGGLTELGKVVEAVRKRRGSKVAPVSEDDIVQAIKKLQKLGGGFQIVQIGDRKVVQSVPGELNLDHNRILELAESNQGWVTVSNVIKDLHFTKDRVETALQALLNEGQAMVDDGAPDGIRRFWFPYLRGIL